MIEEEEEKTKTKRPDKESTASLFLSLFRLANYYTLILLSDAGQKYSHIGFDC